MTPLPAWPSGHRAALCVSIDVDGPYGELNYRSPDDTYWISQTSYDPKGVDRLLAILADRDVLATFCWVAQAAVDHPDLVERAVAAGHEIALHGWDHRYYRLMSDDEQRADMERSLDILTFLSGSPPRGHKTPSWRYNNATHAIAVDLGLEWIMDVPDGDLPSFLETASGTIINLPPSWLSDDYNFFVDQVLTPQQVFEFWRDDFETLYNDGGMLTLTLHPFVSGRPGPSQSLSRLLDFAIDLDDVWIATAGEIATWWRSQSSESLNTLT